MESYAIAIAQDDRFRDTDTEWEFWVVSTEMSESVRVKANQKNRPQGLLLDHPDYKLRIWVRTWGQIIEACGARLRFFQEKLEYASNETAGLQYLRQVHDKYLPDQLRNHTASEHN